MPRSDADAPFVIRDITLHAGTSEHAGLVITPREPVVIGHERIAQLRRPGAESLNEVDRWLLDRIGRGAEGPRVVLFRSVDDAGECVWQFDPSLSDAELEDAGYLLSRVLLPFHRRVLATGVMLMVHTDWGVAECHAMRHGVRTLAAERSRDPHPNAAVQAADEWVLKNMLLHVALQFQHVVREFLPPHLSMLERRYPQVLELVAELPRDAID